MCCFHIPSGSLGVCSSEVRPGFGGVWISLCRVSFGHTFIHQLHPNPGQCMGHSRDPLLPATFSAASGLPLSSSSSSQPQQFHDSMRNGGFAGAWAGVGTGDGSPLADRAKLPLLCGTCPALPACSQLSGAPLPTLCDPSQRGAQPVCGPGDSAEGGTGGTAGQAGITPTAILGTALGSRTNLGAPRARLSWLCLRGSTGMIF